LFLPTLSPEEPKSDEIRVFPKTSFSLGDEHGSNRRSSGAPLPEEFSRRKLHGNAVDPFELTEKIL